MTAKTEVSERARKCAIDIGKEFQASIAAIGIGFEPNTEALARAIDRHFKGYEELATLLDKMLKDAYRPHVRAAAYEAVRRSGVLNQVGEPVEERK